MAAAANVVWGLSSVPAYVAFIAALDDPQRAQQRILRRYITANADMMFGREHGFSHIGSVEEFRRRVPARDYDAFGPYIDRIARGEAGVLTAGGVTRLARSSGSTRAAKFIPYTAELQREFNRAIGPWIVDLFLRDPRLAGSCAYWSISPIVRPSSAQPDRSKGVPVGFEEDGEYLGGARKRLVDAVMAVPAAVRDCDDVDTFRYVTLRFLVARRDLRLISVWHPSFLQLLLAALPRYWERLCEDIAGGKLTLATGTLDPQIHMQLNGTLSPDEQRAAELRAIGPEHWSDLWPQLRLISAWGSGHATGAAAALARRFPGVTFQPKGIIATEAFVTLPFRGHWPLAIRSHFFEFEDDSGRVLAADQIRDGGEYGVIVTTAGGLWRYRLGDRVRVCGRLGRTPSLEFVGRADRVVDRFGEKLSEGFVAAALRRVLARLVSPPVFAMLVPVAGDAAAAGYTLLLEAREPPRQDLPARLDEALRDNPHYAYCRDLGQLQPPKVLLVDHDAYQTYAATLMARGRRLGDIKVDALSGDRALADQFKGRYLTTSEV